jgi:hypothetical protein
MSRNDRVIIISKEEVNNNNTLIGVVRQHKP